MNKSGFKNFLYLLCIFVVSLCVEYIYKVLQHKLVRGPMQYKPNQSCRQKRYKRTSCTSISARSSTKKNISARLYNVKTTQAGMLSENPKTRH